jgi:hypothetical protein
MAIGGAVMTVAGTVSEGFAAKQQGKAQQSMYNDIAKQQEAQGRAQQQEAEYVARQNENIAGQERAKSQRIAIEQQREKRLAQSTGQAVAAASGGGALDPGVLDIMGGIEDQGNYNALVALYEGESSARNFESQAALTRWQGSNALAASKMEAAGSRTQGSMARSAGNSAFTSSLLKGGGQALSSGTSLYSKYGGTGATSSYTAGVYREPAKITYQGKRV